MISSRKEELLKLIVEDYIKSAKPISSKSLCNIMKCSSATIRNEMSELEELGLLEKTHISSGRVPSEKGYRYYVDHLMEPKKISGEDVLKLQTVFHNKSLVFSDTIIKSMEIITELTNYTAFVLGKSSKENKISKVEVVPIHENQFIAIVITDKGHVEHKNMYLEERVSLDEIKQTVDLINKLLVGTPIDEVSAALEFEIKPIISKYVRQHEALYNAFYNAFSDFKNDQSFKMAGAKNMIAAPEFDNTNKIREIISKFEDKSLINNIREEENGINVYIGSENDLDDDLTVIKTKYSINGEEGTIALVGPKRMEYERVVALLNYIKENCE